jgi:hypothetical protein
MNAIINERRKYLATLFNTLAAGSIVTGVFVPTTAFLYGVNAAVPYHWWLIGSAWLVVAAGLHSLAYYVLGKMAP